MKVSSKKIYIDNISTLEARNILKKCIPISNKQKYIKYRNEKVRNILKKELSNKSINNLFNKFLKENIIECKDNIFYSTNKGLRFICAKGRTFKKSNASKKIKELIERVKKINQDDNFAYKVKKVVLFGSVLDENKDIIGDIDVGIDLSGKWGDNNKKTYEYYMKKSIIGTNKKIYGIDMYYPYTKCLKYLKNRSSMLSLHDYQNDKEIIEKNKFKVIFEER